MNPVVGRDNCPTCSNLAPVEIASQKYGWEQNDTLLPDAVSVLQVVRDFQPGGSRQLQLWQCPECSTYYLYHTDYEYLVNGSEDEQTLTRLDDRQAQEYLQRPAAEK